MHTIPEILSLARKYYEKPGNAVGGSLHIVLEDGNTQDGDVMFCLEYAQKQGDMDGVELAELLLSMSKTQRKKLSAMLKI